MADLFVDLPEQSQAQASVETVSCGRVRLREPRRDQVEMQVFDLDELIDAEHPARVIWAYACKVDLSKIVAQVRSREGVAGAPQTSLRLLLALWLYATQDGIGSARALARACETVAAYRWLCGGVSVNHRMLSEFRNNQAAHIEELLVRHVASLSMARLIDLDEVAQDGVRIRASAGGSSFRRRPTLEKELAKARARLEALAAQDKDDGGSNSASGGGSGGASPRQIRAAKEREARVTGALDALAEAEKVRERRQKTHAKQTARQKEPRASTTDPDAKVMKMPDGGFRPAYNIQFASLPKSGIVLAVSCETTGSDGGLAEPMAARLQKDYGRRPVRHLVDGGYQSSSDIAAAEAAAHLFLIDPEDARGVDPDSLIQIAQEARVTVHVVRTRGGGLNGVCDVTGGFEAFDADPSKALAAVYRGLAHRYQATAVTNGAVRSVQVAVRTCDGYGESAVCDFMA